MIQHTAKRSIPGWLFLLSLLFAATGASASTLDVNAGTLTYTAGAGVNNSLTISVGGGKYLLTDTSETIFLTLSAFFAGWIGGGTNSVTGNDATVSTIVILLDTGTNVLNVVSSHSPIFAYGGSGDDTLIVNGNPGILDNLRHTPTGLGAGTVVNDSQTNPNITFAGFEHVQLVLQYADGDGARVDGTIGDDKFQFFHGATADAGTILGTMDQNNATGGGPFALTETIFTGDNQAANDIDVNFFNPGGTDTFEFNGTPFGDSIVVGLGEAGGVQFLNTISGVVVARLEVFNATGSFTINEGDGTNVINLVRNIAPVTVKGGTGDDTLIANGNPTVLDNLRHTPTGLGSGKVINDNAAFPVITFTGIEHLNLALQLGEGDGARVDGTIGDDRFRFFHGATADAGMIVGTMDQNNATGVGPFALTATTYSGSDPVANDVDINFFVPGGMDTIEYNGTADNDTISVMTGEAGGTQLSDTVAGVMISRLEAFNIVSADVLGAGGSDNFNVQPFTSVAINVFGGLPAPPASPGDELKVNVAGTLGGNLTVSTNANGKFGSFAFANRMTVAFQEIETLATGTCPGLTCAAVVGAAARKQQGVGTFDLPLKLSFP